MQKLELCGLMSRFKINFCAQISRNRPFLPCIYNLIFGFFLEDKKLIENKFSE